MLSVYSELVIGVGGLMRPMLLVAGIGGLILVLLRVVLKDWHRAGFFGVLIVLALFRQWGLVVLMILLIDIVIVTSYIRRTPISGERLWPRVTTGANVVTALALALSVASLALGGRLLPGIPTAVTRGAVPDGPPDIYLVLLDGYPRADTLGPGLRIRQLTVREIARGSWV